MGITVTTMTVEDVERRRAEIKKIIQTPSSRSGYGRTPFWSEKSNSSTNSRTSTSCSTARPQPPDRTVSPAAPIGRPSPPAVVTRSKQVSLWSRVSAPGGGPCP